MSAAKLTPQATQEKRSDPMNSSKYCKIILTPLKRSTILLGITKKIPNSPSI